MLVISQTEGPTPSDNINQILQYDGITGTLIGTFVPNDTAHFLYMQDMVFGPEQNLYVTDIEFDQILQFNGINGAFIGNFGPSGVKSYGITMGPDGNLYATDQIGKQVVQITPSGTSSPFATTNLDNPGQLIFGPDGNLYVADLNQDAIVRFDGTTGQFIDVFVPSGPGGLNKPLAYPLDRMAIFM